MRVCHVIETCGGGSGRVVLELMRAGLASGDAMTLLYGTGRSDAFFLEGIEAMAGQAQLCALPMRRALGWRDGYALLRLGLALRRLGPFDVIHSHSSKAGGLARLARFFAPGALQVYTPHGFVTLAPDAPRFYRFAERALGRLSDAIVCVSEAERRHAAEVLKLPARKLYVVPNGLAPSCAAVSRAAARQAMGVSPGTTIVGFVGRLEPQKNPRRALMAFAAAARQRADLVLVVVGAGALRLGLEAAVKEEGIASRVRFVGERPAVLFMAGFDVLLSGSDFEGFPLVFLEAMAAGVPVVTTPCGGAEEAVTEGKTGFVAKAFSDEALAEALAKFLALDAPARSSLAAFARERAGLFSLEACVAAVRDLYRRAQRGEERKERVEPNR
jgi:glycosyltransferase involved in cell wall biosynthesis